MCPWNATETSIPVLGLEICDRDLHRVVRLKHGRKFDLEGLAGLKSDGGRRGKIGRHRIVDGRISVELAARIEGDGIAVHQFIGKNLVGACREIGDAKLAVGACGRSGDGSPERAAVAHLAFVNLHRNAVRLIGRREIHPADNERFGNKRNRDVIAGGVLRRRGTDAGVEKAGLAGGQLKGFINWRIRKD